MRPHDPYSLHAMQGFHWESSKPDCRFPEQWPEGKVTSSWYSTLKDKAKDIREAGERYVSACSPASSSTQCICRIHRHLAAAAEPERGAGGLPAHEAL